MGFLHRYMLAALRVRAQVKLVHGLGGISLIHHHHQSPTTTTDRKSFEQRVNKRQLTTNRMITSA